MLIKDCIFCKIINKDLPTDIIRDAYNCISFYDINPQSKFHILIIPKIHIESSIDIDDSNISYLSNMHLHALKIAEELNLNKNGFRWVVNTGKDGGQTVNHIHLHLLAGRILNWPPG